ncbi:MAG: GH3 auxin-responsive promoter family protein [Flavobacteriales bacterium]|nr:GH3 auxin-responsive promoter family protein [Flavobacteriales bacterium]
MGLKSFFGKIYAKSAVKQIKKWSANPIKTQQDVFQSLISQATKTAFGKDHNFSSIKTYEDFKKSVPIRDYEDLKPYIERIRKGEENVLWEGRPIYFCKTSGTTSGTKYIPISAASISNHIDCARNALLCYINESGNTEFINGKMMFLQGSPTLNEENGIPIGRLSGIVAHHVPSYLLKNRLPSLAANCIEDWETKVDAIIAETIDKDMTLISGIPPWVQMYFEKLIEKSGKETVKELFKNFSLFVHGGVNFEPYRQTFERLIGKKIDTIETYPASEGFIAFQDSQTEEGLLLILDKGIFYEFIPVTEFHNENPTRFSIGEVEIGINYVLILNTNAGLWGYNIGDTIKFVSMSPCRIIVTGRIKHFISAFGEHVIAEEVEYALKVAVQTQLCEINEFHVAPQTSPKDGETAHHEWFIEFATKPTNLDRFVLDIDKVLQEKNSYYFDLRKGNMLDCLQITIIPVGGFNTYMKSQGKLGGQNKTPRLSNDRVLANKLTGDYSNSNDLITASTS